ncbi:MAG TPA: tRNA pseudouridine(55) synthase TruB [Smithellaceae bacterium]|nr:tRNA pseudouridine(55) synthase TruB [Smithellaceae bacterium]HRS88922.1 tRNA pseudouridine(55) synthase TruB [Smithellaceae bacterium]HRV26261.1 tRNA pseudouridine(55) synthase TruB [Smithellaceae bacterium]
MNGAVIIDKPAGKTSHDIVQQVKKILGAKKAGHTGTLDPMATGVLPICLDEATKLAGFLAANEKEYRAIMLLGVQTNTLDVTGKITATSNEMPEQKAIYGVINQMRGKMKQVPPAYSAVKHRGEPLYKWARKGIFPDAAPREVEIFDIEVENICLPQVTFRIACSKGTYVRVLCADIGEKLGCGASLYSLRRLRSGAFSEEMAISPERIKDELLRGFVPMEQLLPSLKAVEVESVFAEKLRNGLQPSIDMMRCYVHPFLGQGDMIKIIDSEKKLVALAQITVAAGMLNKLDGNFPAARIIRVFSAANR